MSVCSCIEKAEVCLFQGVTVLGPGQSLVQYFEAELCYTVQCLHHKDPLSGFYAMEISSVNCSQKCGSVCIQQIKDHINTNCVVVILSQLRLLHLIWPCNTFCCVSVLLFVFGFTSCFSTRCTYHPQTLRCAVAPVKISPVLSPMKMGLQSFSLWEQPDPHPHVLKDSFFKLS